VIKKAIIIHGTGRSGTTLLNSIISCHPSLGWISGYLDKFPEYPRLSHFNKILDSDFLKFHLRNLKGVPKSAEAYQFWNYYLNNFDNIDFNYTELELSKIKKVVDVIERVMRYSNKDRFLMKITGMSRGALLKHIFDKPYVLYITRDPRAVVYSYYKQRWGYKYDLLTFKNKKQEALIAEYCEKYLSFYYDKNKLMNNDFKFINVSYEKIIKSPITEIDKIFNKVNLDFDISVQRYLKSIYLLKNTNKAYLNKLSKTSLKLMEDKLIYPLTEMKYNP
jgi:hypothetical protein